MQKMGYTRSYMSDAKFPVTKVSFFKTRRSNTNNENAYSNFQLMKIKVSV